MKSILAVIILAAATLSCSTKTKIAEDHSATLYRVRETRVVQTDRFKVVKKPVSDPRDPGYGGDPSKKE